LIENHIHDRGGPEVLSEAERSIIRRASVLTVELEMLEQKFATGGDATPAELDLYSRLSNTMRRLLESVGLQRRARDVSAPSLARYLDMQPIPEPLAAPPEAVTLDPVDEPHEEPEDADERPDDEETATLARGEGMADVVEPQSGNIGLPITDPGPVPGQRFEVEGSRATIVYAPRSVDNVGRWAVVDCDDSLKALTMTRSEAERLAAKLKVL
jgi:hypothetical protein